jgi:hypothetical protein
MRKERGGACAEGGGGGQTHTSVGAWRERPHDTNTHAPCLATNVVVTAVAHVREGGILGVVQVPQDHHGGVLGPAEGVELHARVATHRNKTKQKNENGCAVSTSAQYFLPSRT